MTIKDSPARRITLENLEKERTVGKTDAEVGNVSYAVI
jgi:hypothetical protein